MHVNAKLLSLLNGWRARYESNTILIQKNFSYQKLQKMFYFGFNKNVNLDLESNRSNYLDFFYFEFKIRLGFSFQKQKILYLNSQPTDSQSGVITITPKKQRWVGGDPESFQ